jgi:hypothetical protein
MKVLFVILGVALLAGAEVDKHVQDKIEMLRGRELGKTLFATVSM